MQLILPTQQMRLARGPFLRGTVVGGLLLAGGLGLGWLAIATPVIQGLAPIVVRPSTEQILLGAIVWGVSLVGPPAFAIGGAIRLGIVATNLLQRPKVGPVSGAIPLLGDEYVVAPSVALPDGRAIRNVVIGPFGVAVIGELPTPSNTRRQGTAWEVRRIDGRWWPLEDPLERASRDAERIRHWIAAEDRDFVVKVYAAVLIRDASVSRTRSCAAITADQIPGWLASLPPQRSLNPDRLAGVVERIRSIA
jgi:hypothetical protein